VHRTCVRELTVYSDGASRNNPGDAGVGLFIMRNGKTLERITQYLGTTTSDIAEYTAAITGLERAVQLGASSVKQINGLYKVKNEGLKPLHARAKELIAKIGSVEVQYLPRAMNKEADTLANKAIDDKISSQ
jgi:ribonuclease HI